MFTKEQMAEYEAKHAATMIDGWGCWVGPSGTRYAAPGGKTVIGVVNALCELSHVPESVVEWLQGGVLRLW